MRNRFIALIPAYEPDAKIADLTGELKNRSFDIVIVDDGSGVEYASLFEKASEMLGENGHVLHHEVGLGILTFREKARQILIEAKPR